jgi:CspA family cold shock protein
LPINIFFNEDAEAFKVSCIFIASTIILMKTGTIKFFNATKGFGFVKVDNTDQEVFVHVTGLIDQVNEGDNVSFDVIEGRKGLNAINVKKI